MKVIRTEKLFDFPIQFKELNHSDFEGFLFEDKEKVIISPNEKGYISEALAEVIDLEKSDTTVINASVGQVENPEKMTTSIWRNRSLDSVSK